MVRPTPGVWLRAAPCEMCRGQRCGGGQNPSRKPPLSWLLARRGAGPVYSGAVSSARAAWAPLPEEAYGAAHGKARPVPAEHNSSGRLLALTPAAPLTLCLGALLLDALSNIARDSDRAFGDAARGFHQGEGHFDIELAAALVFRTRQGWPTLQSHQPGRHCRLEGAPVRILQVLRDDQVQRLPARLCRAVAEQGRGGGVPENNAPGSVAADNRVRHLLQDRLRRQDPVFSSHAGAPTPRAPDEA